MPYEPFLLGVGVVFTLLKMGRLAPVLDSFCKAKTQPFFVSFQFLGWPRSTVEKGPQSNESYERENPWNRTISTVLWVHRKLPHSTVKLVLPSNESYESKTGCNRTLANVLWVPLSFLRELNCSSYPSFSLCFIPQIYCKIHKICLDNDPFGEGVGNRQSFEAIFVCLGI